MENETLQAISAAVVALCGATAAVLKKRQGRISDRRDSSAHRLRREKYIWQESYARAVHTLGSIRDDARLATELHRAGAPTDHLWEKLMSYFPNGKVPDYVDSVDSELSRAERMQEDAEGDEEN